MTCEEMRGQSSNFDVSSCDDPAYAANVTNATCAQNVTCTTHGEDSCAQNATCTTYGNGKDFKKYSCCCHQCDDTMYLYFLIAFMIYANIMIVLYKAAGVRVGRDFLTTGRMFIVRLQVFFLHFNFQLKWPAFMKAIARWLGQLVHIALPEIADAECLIGDVGALEAWSMRQWTPLLFVLPFLLIASRQNQKSDRYKYYAIVYNVIGIFFASAAAGFFEAFTQDDLNDDAATKFQAVVSVFVYFLLPLYMLLRMLRVARAAETDSSTRKELYGRLFAKYDHSREMWDVVPKTTQILTACVASLVCPATSQGLLSLFCVQAGALLLQWWQRPYVSSDMRIHRAAGKARQRERMRSWSVLDRLDFRLILVTMAQLVVGLLQTEESVCGVMQERYGKVSIADLLLLLLLFVMIWMFVVAFQEEEDALSSEIRRLRGCRWLCNSRCWLALCPTPKEKVQRKRDWRRPSAAPRVRIVKASVEEFLATVWERIEVSASGSCAPSATDSGVGSSPSKRTTRATSKRSKERTPPRQTQAGRKTSARVQDSGGGPRVAYRVRAHIASLNSLAGEMPRTNCTTRELRVGDVVDESGYEHFEFPMNECLTVDSKFRIGVDLFAIEEWLENKAALLVSDLALKIDKGSLEASELQRQTRRLETWVRGDAGRPELEELLCYIGAEQREALVSACDAAQREVASCKEAREHAKASMKQAEALEIETPEDRRKAQLLLEMYHDEGKQLLRKAELMYGGAAASNDASDPMQSVDQDHLKMMNEAARKAEMTLADVQTEQMGIKKEGLRKRRNAYNAAKARVEDAVRSADEFLQGPTGFLAAIRRNLRLKLARCVAARDAESAAAVACTRVPRLIRISAGAHPSASQAMRPAPLRTGRRGCRHWQDMEAPVLHAQTVGAKKRRR